MDVSKLLDIIKKNVDEAQLAKDLMAEFAKPLLVQAVAKIRSFDPVPSSNLDNAALEAIASFLEKEFDLV